MKNLNGITLSVPGGLAGQLFAVGYAAWLSSKRNIPVHIEFHHMGSSIGTFGAVGVLNSEIAKSLGISFSVVDTSWPPEGRLIRIASRFTTDSIFRVARAATFGFYLVLRGAHSRQKSLTTPVVSYPLGANRLLNAPLDSRISGYPTDYRIIEESWDLLSRMISTSGHPNFVEDTGKEETVAIHWRLGDYVQNSYHGAVSGSSLANCLKYANVENLPVKLFTDSPDIAEQVIRDSPSFSKCLSDYEIVSGDVWSDLYGMTRSKVFIGSHSGVSFLAALALRSNNSGSMTWLPDKWFLNQHAQYLFHHGPRTADASVFYPANLVDSPIPL